MVHLSIHIKRENLVDDFQGFEPIMDFEDSRKLSFVDGGEGKERSRMLGVLCFFGCCRMYHSSCFLCRLKNVILSVQP